MLAVRKRRSPIEKAGHRPKKPGAHLSVKGLVFGLDEKGLHVNNKKTNNCMKKNKGQEVETGICSRKTYSGPVSAWKSATKMQTRGRGHSAPLTWANVTVGPNRGEGRGGCHPADCNRCLRLHWGPFTMIPVAPSPRCPLWMNLLPMVKTQGKIGSF